MRLILLLLLVVSSLHCVNEKPRQAQPPHPEPAAAPAIISPRFDGTRAFQHLVKQTAFGPRNPNSRGHGACLDYLASTLRQLSDEVVLQPFTAEGYNEVLAMTNIIARFKPDAPARILLCAHWDTRPRAENDPNKERRDQPILGANDGASGVAVLLEIASLLKHVPPPIGVDLVLFDGEDYGHEGDLSKYFLGSRHFISNRPKNFNPRFGILVDMVGDAFLDLPKEYYSVQYAPDIVKLVWDKARTLGYSQFLDEIGEAVNDDHVPLNEAGIKTINIIDFNYPDPSHRFWHTHDDTPDKCSAESLEAVGTVLTHIIYTQRP